MLKADEQIDRYGQSIASSEDRERDVPGFFSHYKLLLWKSFLLRIRSPIGILAELAIPLLLIIVLIGVRSAEPPITFPPCYLVSQPLPTMGFLKYMRSVICNFNFSCSSHDVDDQGHLPLDHPLIQLLTDKDKGTLENMLVVIQTLAKDEVPLSERNFTSISDFICFPEMQNWLHSKTSWKVLSSVKTLCTFPKFIRGPIVSSFTAKMMGEVGHVLPTETAPVEQNLTIDRLTDLVGNASLLICGNQAGSNSYLGLLKFLKGIASNQSRSRMYHRIIEDASSEDRRPRSACSMLNSIFGISILEPWISRLRAALQGEVYFYPLTNDTMEILKRANTTANMLSQLRNISNQWVSQMDTLMPHLFTNSSLAKTVRFMSFVCSRDPSINPETREKCRRLYLFLGATPSANYTHWSNFVPIITNISEAVDDILTNCVVYDRFHGFDNDTLMYESLDLAMQAGRTVLAIEFETSDKKLLSMKFRLPPRQIDGTKGFKVLDKSWSPKPRNSAIDSMKYFTSGFIDLQDQIEHAYIALKTQVSVPNNLYENKFLPTEMQFVPGPCYQDDPLLRLFVSYTPILIVVIWMCNYVLNVRAIVYEKEVRLKEFTKVMGMGNFVHWLNWFTVGLVMTVTPSAIATLMLKYGGIFTHADIFLIFSCFVAYMLAILPQAFLISVFFTNANFGAVFAAIVYFVLYLPYNLVVIYNLEFLPLLILSFLPQCGVALTFSRLMTLEIQGIGGQWNNLWVNDLTNDTFSLGNALLMLLVDGALAWIGVWYLENVVPSSLGLTLPWYFPFTKSYWQEFFNRRSTSRQTNNTERPIDVLDPNYHETSREVLPVGVSIHGLTKYFGRKKPAAVDNMWVDFYENQITSFLGHNGAGKTTTISILTGIYTPSSGTAFIYGQDINTAMSTIRRDLGLCPQYNVLFDNLTVSEHIRFYGALKGLSRNEVNAELELYLRELGLEKKANALAKQLSGGQKRRLSLAAAFVGGSKIVFLDEPTAGVDPSSRRSIWNLIFHFKASRTIILTTHHMDEADILGDRIVIVSQGRVKASGSSLFLKSHFAKHYYLTIEKSENQAINERKDKELAHLLSSQLSGANLMVSNPTEWIFTLPATLIYDVKGFSRFFAYLESNKAKLFEEFGVKNTSLSDTTLEEIFILLSDDPNKVAQMETSSRRNIIKKLFSRRNHHSNQFEEPPNETHENTDIVSTGPEENGHFEAENNVLGVSTYIKPPKVNTIERNKGCQLYLQQCLACLAKRWYFVLRSKRGWFLEVTAPVITIVIMLVIITTYPTESSQPPSMPIHPWLMANRKNVPSLDTFYAGCSDTANPQIREISYLYSQEIATARGWSGTRCLPKSVYELIPSKFDFCNLEGYKTPHPLPALSSSDVLKAKASANISCSCDAGSISCPPGSVVLPPGHSLPSTDFLKNLTHYNVSNYLLKTRNQAILKRYGGLQFAVANSPEKIIALKYLLSNETLMSDILNLAFSSPEATSLGLMLGKFVSTSLPPTHFARIWYHNKGYASSTAYLNVLHNMQLRMFLRNDKNVQDAENYGLAIASFPLPTVQQKVNRDFFISLTVELIKSIGVVFAIALVASSFATFVIRESQCGSKSLQFLSGHSRLVYWSITYLWDYISLFFPMAFIVILFLIFNEQAYISRDAIGGFIVLLLVYGLALIPLMYCFTFLFKLASIAFVSLLAFNIMIALITTTVVFMLDIIGSNNASISYAVSIMEKAFLVFPQFAFCQGVFDLAKVHLVKMLELESLVGPMDLFEWDRLTIKLVAMIVEAIGFFTIVLLIEYSKVWNCYKNCRRRERGQKITDVEVHNDAFESEKNEDVSRERERVEKDPSNTLQDVVRAVHITKYYPKCKTPAVQDVTFGVRPGECFGLLGVNGAGKTTTFNMLTTTTHPTAGKISVGCFDVSEHPEAKFHELIGYCPQFDALHSHLTGFETLQLYARIRGFPESIITSVVNCLIDRMSLRTHANKPAYSYSGGNLRKLSTAVAIIGHPQVLFLDEPTSGMDPGAKRCFWEEVKKLLHDGCSVVLTSHTMEECEVLCNRVAIMIDGQFQCFGTVSELKKRFGEGYIVETDLVDETRCPKIVLSPPSFISITDHVGKRCNFEARGEVSLSELLQQLIQARDSGFISTFAVREASLDSVFVNFVRNYENVRKKYSEESGSSSSSVAELDRVGIF